MMASRPSTAASAVVMNAANSSGIRSTQLRAASLMASNASKLTASVSGRRGRVPEPGLDGLGLRHVFTFLASHRADQAATLRASPMVSAIWRR